MHMNLADLLVQTLRDPQNAARRVLAFSPAAGGMWLWEALALVIVSSVFLTLLGQVIAPAQGNLLISAFTANPITMVTVEAAMLVITVFAVFRIGRWAGGTGSFEGSLRLVVWLQAVLVSVQAAQTVVLLLMPGFASLIGLFGLVLFFWLLTQFVLVLHGFSSPYRVFGAILLSMLGIIMALSLALALLSGLFAGGAVNV